MKELILTTIDIIEVNTNLFVHRGIWFRDIMSPLDIICFYHRPRQAHNVVEGTMFMD